MFLDFCKILMKGGHLKVIEPQRNTFLLLAILEVLDP